MAAPALRDDAGRPAVVGRSSGLWLCAADFVASDNADGTTLPSCLASLGFPRDLPSVYAQSAALKSLIGKRGRIPSRRAAVAGEPTPEQRARAPADGFHPLQSFANAERAERLGGLTVVRGWAVFERLDRSPGEAFVAERYWWNALPDGTWVDLTPRPKALPSFLLAEAVDGAPKARSVLTSAEEALASRLLDARFPGWRMEAAPVGQAATAAGASSAPRPAPPAKAEPKEQVAAAPLDYSKWGKIVDSDDEEEESEAARARAAAEEAARRGQQQEAAFGARDLAEGRQARRQPPIPDFLVGNTGGGGGTNCYLSLCRLLDADASKPKADSNLHQLAQSFGKSLRCGMLDAARQRFYGDAIEESPKGAFFVVLGLGSILPLLRVARRGAGGVLLELSARLTGLATEILQANGLSVPAVAVPEGLDKDEVVRRALAQHLPADAEHVVVLSELLAPDLLSSGIVPAMTTAHAAVRAIAPRAEVRHVPRTVELHATPMEIRSEKLGGIDIRAFNGFRHTSSNDRADFWWWPVRLDNQAACTVAALGSQHTLCGFDFQRSPEIGFDEVRRSVKLKIAKRGRCNAVALWWTAAVGERRYSTRPLSEDKGAHGAPLCRSEWKQAVHYLAGETAVFVGDVLQVLVSITPRFTIRMMQESPFSVEAPVWVKAPTEAKISATLPILPYHFLMMTDVHRLEVYGRAIRDAVSQQRWRLGRRVRVLDAGCGLGLLGITAALQGADVWLCEAVPVMRQMCREVISANAKDIADRQGLVQLLPAMMSTRLQIGEDAAEKFDVVVSEVMDLWCLGEGIIPTMRHAHQKLLAPGGVLLPSQLAIFAQPIELQVWAQAEREHRSKLSPLGRLFKSKFSPMRLAQFPYRALSDEPVAALEIDLRNVPKQPSDGVPNLENSSLCIRMGGKPALQAKVHQVPITESGMLCGYGIWWAADLGNGHVLSSAPKSPQRSWKQLVRWLDEPRFVSEGDEVQMLACYSEQQVNIEDVFMPKEVVEQVQEQLAAEAPRQRPPPSAAAAAGGEAARPKRSDASDRAVAAALGVAGAELGAVSAKASAASTPVRAGAHDDGEDDAMLEVD